MTVTEEIYSVRAERSIQSDVTAELRCLIMYVCIEIRQINGWTRINDLVCPILFFVYSIGYIFLMKTKNLY